MSQYFPPYRSSKSNSKVKLDLISYATKADLKNVTHVDVSNFELKTNLANLKTEVDKVDVGKLKTFPVDLAKLSTVVKNIDTTNFVSRTKYENDGSDLENKTRNVDKKISDISGFVQKNKFQC